MLRWKSSLKPAAAASGLQTPTLLGTRNPTNTGRSNTSINISSATQGALLLASVTARSIQENLSDPTEGGWTLLASVDNGSSSNRPLNRVYYKTAGASESTVTWTHDSDYTTAVAIEIVGADTSTLAVTTNQASPTLGVVTVPTNGFVIAVHAKGDNSNTSSSQVRLDDGVTVQTQYTMLGDAYGTQRSGTFMAVGNVGAGNTNGTDKIVGAGDGSRSATHHIAIKPSGATNGLSTGLIRAYLAEDLTDELGNANLTVRGSGISSTTGKNNNCYTYSTSGGHVSDWFPDSNNWTISCWINADAIDSATFNGTIGCHDNNNHRAYFGLGNSNEAVVGVGDSYDTDSAATYSAGTWYNFITIWDGTNAWCFINGVLRIKFAANFSGTSTDALHLGERIYNGSSYNQYDGKQDETYIWNRALDVGTATSVGDTGGGDIANLQTLFYASFNGFADYRSTVLADNPLFYYRLGESSGTTAYDEVAAGYNGTYYNTPTLGQTGAISGNLNTAVKFDESSSEYATTVTLSETSLLPCTFECFIKIDGDSDPWAGIIFYRATNAQASGLNIKNNVQGKLGYHWNNTTVYQYDSAPTLANNTWYYVALVVESTKATFYVIEEDGTLTSSVNTTTHTALDASGAGWLIALDDATTRYFNGTLDEVALYDQALSQSTVVAHAAAAGYTS